MGMKNLDRLSRSKPATIAPSASLEFTNYDPRYDTSLPLEQRKQHVLSSGLWVLPTQLFQFRITREEQAAAWIAHPDARALAADPHVPSNIPQGPGAYERYALHAHAQGWLSVFPETDGTDGERKPAAAPPAWKLRQDRKGELIATSANYNPTEARKWAVKTRDRRGLGIAAADLIQEVENVSRRDNVAIAIGPASGNVRVLDIDVVDFELAKQIRDLAFRILGFTPFVRIGRSPKLQLIYRVDEEAMLSFPTRSWALLGADGQPDLEDRKPRNAVEWLGYGRHFTVYGLHHKTRQSFDWSQGTLHPAIAGPEHAPVVTAKQFKQFLTELYSLRKFVAKGGSSSNPFGNGNAETTAFIRDADIWIPKTSTGDWVVDGDGVVVDGREDYIAHLAWVFGGANAELMMTDEGASAVLLAFIDYATRTCDAGKVKDRPAEIECRAKWPNVKKKWRASIKHHEQRGEYIKGRVPFRINPLDGRRPCSQHITPAARPVDGSLDWLPAATSIVPELADRSKIAGVVAVEKSVAEIKSDREMRALIEDEAKRAVSHAKASAEVRAALVKFLQEMLANELEPGLELPVHILSAPTGGGKTTMTISEIAEILKLYPRKPSQGPILIAVPTHANAEEGLKTAARNGMTVPADIEIEKIFAAEMAALRGAGLIVEIFRGKIKAGCKRADEITALVDKGISAGNLCGVKIDAEDEGDALLWGNDVAELEADEDGKIEILCPFRADGSCGYWQQHAKVEAADIVFVPHAYLTTPRVPKPLKNPRAIFIDESVVFRLLHTVLMPIAALESMRPEPWLTQKEKDQGLKADDQLGLRDQACDVALNALAAGQDVAATFLARKKGAMLLDAAVRVCRRAHTRERDVRPDLTIPEIMEIANRPKGGHLRVEQRFWALVQERYNTLVEDAATGSKQARGTHDARVRVVHVPDDDCIPQPTVRLSWRSQPNWADRPMMLLDASASPRIMGKIFKRPIVEHKVTAPMHVRTVAMIDSAFSNASFIPRHNATEKEVAICAWNIERARRLILKVGAIYSYGPVIVGMTKSVRQAIFTPDWMAPPNVQPMHFGALRGLDYAKDAVAALSIGRSEMPIHIVDGFVAALTYDDHTPEQPYDLFGHGLTAEGKPLMRHGVERRIMMRTGEDWDHYVPSMPSALTPKSGIGPSKPLWSGEIESQWREEELRQFLGRLRPVYRSGEAPVWICMSKCLPSDTIVDDIVTLDDLIADHDVWAVCAMAGGVLANGVTEKLPGIREIVGKQTVAAFVSEMLGTDVALNNKIGAGMAKVRYQLEADGPIMHGRIAVWERDPEQTFRNVCDAIGVEPTMVEITSQERAYVDLKLHKADRLTVALDKARGDQRLQKKAAAKRHFIERIHALLPLEEGLTIKDLEERHARGDDLEQLLISWLHSWRDDRDEVSINDTVAMWAELKGQGPDAVDRAFGIARCMAAE